MAVMITTVMRILEFRKRAAGTVKTINGDTNKPYVKWKRILVPIGLRVSQPSLVRLDGNKDSKI